MAKRRKEEEIRKDFMWGKSHEKYNSVLHRKKGIDSNYEGKMKDLQRRIKMKECHGAKLSPEAYRDKQRQLMKASRYGEGEINIEDEISVGEGDETHQNRDVNEATNASYARNVNFELSRSKSGPFGLTTKT